MSDPLSPSPVEAESAETEWAALIPEEYKRLGWSGVFITEAALQDTRPIAVEEFAAKLPARVPFGSNSGWLALCLNRAVDPLTVVLCRRDSDALADFVRVPR